MSPWIAAVALSGLLVACGGGATPVASPPATPASAAPSASDGDGAACATVGDGQESGATAAVVIGQFFQYDPDPTEVTIGTTVTWTNPDNLLHTVTAGTPAAPQAEVFDCEMDGVGDGEPTASVTFTAVGEYPYFCTRHGDAMTGTVVVTG